MGTVTRNFANNVLTNGTVDATDGLTGTIPASNITDASITSLTAFPASVGDFVEATASDVAASAATEGQIFYNTTSGKLKGINLTAAAWASAANRANSFAGSSGFGTQTATIVASGYPPSVPPISVATEEYNGSSWSNGGNVGTARAMGIGFGTQTAGTIYGGGTTFSAGFTTFTSNTEEYNGTSWTAANSYGENIWYGGAAGTQTAGVSIGGLYTSSSPTSQTTTKEYDGTNWTSGGNINVAGNARRGSGTQTAALAASKAPSPTGPRTVTEEYNGTSWTTASPLNVDSAYRAGSTAGTQTASLIFGGEPATTSTEEYDGTSWATSSANLATTKGSASQTGGGTAAAAIFPGGELMPPGVATNITEEYTGAFYSAKSITTS